MITEKKFQKVVSHFYNDPVGIGNFCSMRCYHGYWPDIVTLNDVYKYRKLYGKDNYQGKGIYTKRTIRRF
jgi:hypothetical protein